SRDRLRSTHSREVAAHLVCGHREAGAAMTEPPIAPVPGLPALAGLCSVEAALAPALPVADVVARLKRLHFATRRTHGLLLARLPSEPLYELKMLYSYHAYLCAEITAALRARVGEMREPPLGLDD